jgi:hypothetical protein
MGYQLVAGTAMESLSEKAWLDLIALAALHGSAAPRLGYLVRDAATYLTEEEAAGLHAALERVLTVVVLQEHITTEHDVLDRDTARRVSHVLRQPGLKMLRRTPPWR